MSALQGSSRGRATGAKCAPGLNSFLSRDMYNGALSDVALTTDPFTGSRYAFGDGNPISNIELDGHMFPVGGGAAGCPYGTIGCLGYHPPSTSSGGGNQPNCWEGSYCVPQPHLPPGWSFQRIGPWAGVVTHTWQQRECSPGGARTGAPFCWMQTNQQQFNVGTVCGGGARSGAPHCYPASDFLTPSQGTAVFWAIMGAAGSAGLGAALDALGAAEDAGAAGATASRGVSLSLRYKAGWSPEEIAAADAKVATLNAAAQRGELVVSQVERSGTSAAWVFRSAGGAIPPGMDVDHMIDLQLGGLDEIANMSPLEREPQPGCPDCGAAPRRSCRDVCHRR